MNTNDPEEMPLSQAEPYRTPAEVSAPAKQGSVGSPIAWVVAVGLVTVAAAALLMTPLSKRRDNSIDYVEEFGTSRAGPPIEEVVEPYEELSAVPAP